MVFDDEAGLILTHRILVTRICNPLLDQPWGAGRFTTREVHQALMAPERSAAGWCDQHAPRVADRAEVSRVSVDPLSRPECRACELGRVVSIAAALRSMAAPIDLAEAEASARVLLALRPEPHHITVDVGLGGFLPPWLIADGNHRVAAATVTNWPWLVLEVAGDWDRAMALFVEGVSLSDVLDQGR